MEQGVMGVCKILMVYLVLIIKVFAPASLFLYHDINR
jgi:hypothetical protein